jgi:hypothetical protein
VCPILPPKYFAEFFSAHLTGHSGKPSVLSRLRAWAFSTQSYSTNIAVTPLLLAATARRQPVC